MGSCSIYDEDNNLLLKTCTSDDEDLDSLWLQDSSFNCLRASAASSSMVNFEDHAKPGKARSSEEMITVFDAVSCSSQAKKRRLSTDQVHYLEKSFEVDNKLEPDRKVQLAKELNLQPRQVAIWFQNRRARYKTKLLQKDYDVLKSSYDRLKQDFDTLYSQNEKLKNEVNMLVEKLQVKEKGSDDDQVKKEQCDDDVNKQSNTSSTKSDVLDSDSPRYYSTDHGIQSTTVLELDERGDSSHVFEAAETTMSDYEEGESLSKSLLLQASCLLPKIEVADDDGDESCYDNDYLQPNSCNLGFPVQNQGTWFWQI